jgi:small-conductance mechanosensitive channel
MAISMRAFLGFIAASISVLTFHQGMVAALHVFGLTQSAAYRTTPVPPFGVPLIVDLCFWAGLYGLVFGLLMPRFTWPLWLCGLILGVIAALVAMFVVAPLKGNAIANGWQAWPIARSLLINGVWGIGVGLILPLLMPRALVGAHT